MMFSYTNPKLEQTVAGIHFVNPIGLAAGFDKDAVLTDIMAEVGFGFEEVGSITGEKCAGNPRPRLWRMKKSKGLVVYYGLKNAGCAIIAKRLSGKRFSLPIGTSVAMTNDETTATREAGIADYAKAFRSFVDIGDYVTINISCPNTCGGEPFTDPEALDTLLMTIDTIPTKKPIFLKISADLPTEQLDAIIAVSDRHRVTGFICTNLTKKRGTEHIKDENIPAHGGMSGKVVKDLSDAMIEYMYGKTRGRYTIIGCGGIFSAADAYKKITLGASLVQMITGMIFEGPQVISEINQGLVHMIEADGFKTIAEAVGSKNR
jgi:dihydroorotate dehydrogenase